MERDEKEVVQKRVGDDSFVDKPEPIRLSSNRQSIISDNEGIPSTHSKSLKQKCPKCGSILQEYNVREYRGGDEEFSLICPNCGRVDPSDLIPNKEDKCKDCFAYQFDHKLGYYCTAPVCIKEYNYDPETKSWILILKDKTKSSELVQIKNEIAKLKEIVLEFLKFMDSLATYFASKYNTEIALTIRTHISRIREQVKLYEK